MNSFLSAYLVSHRKQSNGNRSVMRACSKEVGKFDLPFTTPAKGDCADHEANSLPADVRGHLPLMNKIP
jgi:hypothetical protein